MTDRVADERTIEDILAQHPAIAEAILDVAPGSLVLVDRQRVLPTGRTDLLFLHGTTLIIAELKVESAREEHLDQVSGYRDELAGTNFALDYELEPIVVAPSVSGRVSEVAKKRGIKTYEYDSKKVLSAFNQRLQDATSAFEKPPMLTGVGHLNYIHGLLEKLTDGPQVVGDLAADSDVFKDTGHRQPSDRLRKLARLGIRLQLVSVPGKTSGGIDSLRISQEDKLDLTERGQRYTEELDRGSNFWEVTDEQATLIIGLLYEQPFYSGITHGMLLLLDSVFELSKNTTPVRREDLLDWFPKKAGKGSEWSEGARSRKDAIDWFGTYLTEVGVIARVDQGYYLTPSGFELLAYHYIDIGKEMVRSE